MCSNLVSRQYLLELKAFRVVGEFDFQGFFCPAAYVINKISLVSFPGTANLPKNKGKFSSLQMADHSRGWSRKPREDFSACFFLWFRQPIRSHGAVLTTRKLVRMKIVISLLRVVAQNWNFDLSAGNLTGKLINLSFPRCIANSKPDSGGKRQGFDDKKPNWNALWRNIWLAILKQIRLRSETHWKLLLYLDFCSYFEATSPNWFNDFCKILLQSIFLARIINKSRPKSHQLIP